MKERLRARGARLLARVSPTAAARVGPPGDAHPQVRSNKQQIALLKERVAELESEMQETRRLNLRVAELTDIVQELLIPIAQRDEDELRRRLERYSASL